MTRFPYDLRMITKYDISCSEGRVEFAEFRQLVSLLRQEASLCAIEAEVTITRDQVVVFQPWNDVGQELDLSISITVCSKVVDPDWLALGHGGSIGDDVLEFLLTIGTRSPEPVNTHETNGAASRLAQVEELSEPLEVDRVLEIAWSPE